jgi:hypothetical protein
MPDFTRYVPPGVYVDANSVPTIAPPGVDPTIVALIGEGIGYHTYTETVSFASAASAVLTKQGINPSSIVVSGVITDPAAPGQTVPYTFAPDVVGTPADYSVTVNSTSGIDTSIATLSRTSNGKIEVAHPEVSVTYHYTDADYHAVHAFDDYDAITEVYGQALDPVTGEIQSPLSFAAQIAMGNGANQLYCVALSGVGSISQQFLDAYDMLANNHQANVIVPLLRGLTTAGAYAGMLLSFKGVVEADARAGVLRMMIIGSDKGYDPTASDLATVGSQTSCSRIVIPWPNRLLVYNGVANQTVEVDGFYLAAAYAGMLAARAYQMPLTRKYPNNFLGFPAPVQQAMTKRVKNQLSSAGICVTEQDRTGRLVIRHGLTTDFTGGVLSREISLVRAQDALYYLIQQTMDSAGLIGIPIEADTGLRVKSIVSGGLEQAKATGLIVDYNNLKVRQQSPPSGDPTVIEVKFAYKPAWPLNYILVSFTVDTSTGESTLTSSNTAISDAATIASIASGG